MFGSRKALLKQTSHTNGRGGFNANVFSPGATPQDTAPSTGDRVQVGWQQDLVDRSMLDTVHVICIHTVQMALLAATRDRETAQIALAEAKTRQDETTEVLATFAVRHTLRTHINVTVSANSWQVLQCSNWIMVLCLYRS